MNKSRLIVSYAVVMTVAVVLMFVKIISMNNERITLNEGNNSNQKVVETLKKENKEIKDKYFELEKEKIRLERKVEALSENDDSEKLIKELEEKVTTLEKSDKELKAKNEELTKTVEARDKDIMEQDDELKKEVNARYEVVDKYNQEILGIVDMLNMNPDIFEYGEDGLINPQYALNVIEINRRDAMEYGHLQMLLYEATGIHEPEEALRYLLEKASEVNENIG